MKKIFAIALAVVMVLSMASAFAASPCYTWGTSWPCSVDADLCGKGSVEVVPYVKVNTSCGWEWQVSDCAAAIKTEHVYYALKLTVDANPDPDWWAVATLTVENEGLVDAFEFDGAFTAPAAAGEYYLAVNQSGWFDLEDWSDLTAREQEAYIFEAEVDEGINACNNDGFSVCATLASFYDGGSNVEFNKLGDYTYEFTQYPVFADMDAVEDNDAAYDGKLTIADADDAKKKVVFTVVDGAIVTPDWSKADADFFNAVMADFGFNACGTAACVTYLNVQQNFGWNDAQKDCFDWSEKGMAVVDTDCVVAIPKTGDASVLAWLF